MAFVLAVEAWQCERSVSNRGRDAIDSRLWAQEGQMRAGRGAGLVGAIGTIAVVVVDSERWYTDGRVADARECLGVFVVFGDCRVWSAVVSR